MADRDAVEAGFSGDGDAVIEAERVDDRRSNTSLSDRAGDDDAIASQQGQIAG
jgi:hypothetical protein